ncbi:amidohydrolase [Melghiribacillus thermohalophilus]|uniref:Amidohydrolase n=1 Tax=Melghiribacillus thermohalophilus TaxID=1324956 RepID=A0A4R3MYL3_9BACI|nr:M20 peptidase aminoacylase family protein [Melghiribacillus thermohalophilus]TCT19379.1 amidohydrolase [Melghiribacillus thermohalophilus]
MRDQIEELRPQIMEMFRHLHSTPEISWEEFETTKYLKHFLEKQGLQVRTFDSSTGLVADLGRGKPVVALRADIDALWQEVDGKLQANHSCGHDAHMAMAAGVVLVLKDYLSKNEGTVRFLFQPAEEKGTGALHFINEKVIDDVDYLYGVHLRPVQEIPDGTASPAIQHGAARFISGKISGEDTHGARPHLGVNAIEVGAALVNLIKGIHADPMVPHSIKMTRFHGGEKNANIIPGSASFSLDLRAQTNEVMEELTRKTYEIVNHLAKLHEVEIELEVAADVAAAKIHPEAQQIMAISIEETLGKFCLKEPVVTTGGDDFHFYTIKRPHVKATMLGLGCGLTPGLHHPKMTFNHDAILVGVEILSRTIMRTLRGG